MSIRQERSREIYSTMVAIALVATWRRINRRLLSLGTFVESIRGRLFRLDVNRFGANRHVPILIHPNPLNLRRYVVLNTGFTFSEFGDASNALQTPKLPDYAIIDINVPRSSRLAKGVVDAGFFE